MSKLRDPFFRSLLVRTKTSSPDAWIRLSRDLATHYLELEDGDPNLNMERAMAVSQPVIDYLLGRVEEPPEYDFSFVDVPLDSAQQSRES